MQKSMIVNSNILQRSTEKSIKEIKSNSRSKSTPRFHSMNKSKLNKHSIGKLNKIDKNLRF